MSDKQTMSHLFIKNENPPNKLEEIIKIQCYINNKFFMPEVLNIEEKQRWTWLLTLALMDELSEILGHINWKWWKKQKIEVNQNELKFEFIDIMVFTISLMKLWGMDAKEIYNMYIAKSEENINRQKRGY